ncbi:MAG: LCCL domain-containing protein [Pirellulaceae bacterium]|nr:LCCL domain-containing protein [Pirellulaceae bacterium]
MNLSQSMLFALITALVVSTTPLVAHEPSATAQGLPLEAQKAVADYDAQVAAIQSKAAVEMEAIRKRVEREILSAREECRKALKVAQDTYTKAGKLDEAVAIRDRIATLSIGGEIFPDPGTLSKYNDQVGKSFYFEVVGGISGSLYGDGTYTTDSTLSKAAMHCGLLKEGQKGIVKVTVLPGDRAHVSATKNGISSSSWGSWHASYKVELVQLSVEVGKP